MHIIYITHYNNYIIYLYIKVINMFGDEQSQNNCFNQLFLQNIWIMQKLDFLSENHSQHMILGHGAYGLNNMATKIKRCGIRAFVDTSYS